MARYRRYRPQRNYGGYRGRSKSTVILRRLALVLVVLLAVLGGLYLWLKPHMISTPGGVTLDLPWFQQEAGPVETAEPAPAPEPTEEPEPSPEPVTPANAAVHAVEVTAAELLDGRAMEKLAAAGGNALLVTMKDREGRLSYVSELELAQALQSSGGDLKVNEAVRQLHEEGVYLVARMECFRDELLPYYDADTALRTHSGYRWTDPEGIHWVDPTNDTVRNYLKDVARELAEMGFDEIVLSAAAYPTEGHLEYLQEGASYPVEQEDGLTQVLDRFYEEMAVVLADTPARLSVESREGVLINGSDARSGQTAPVLAAHAWRVWVKLEEAGAAGLGQTLAQAGMKQPGQGVVSMSAQEAGLPQEESWALLSAGADS